ncbi:MAG: DUF4919 domain-containing protein [Bacteroidaceae bacterium]|nr:DUF4919 domain-containing protein [Bacteroidaceae bacterium]MBQ3538429.1 DUF4919 domain-containing protein [Bacteroidaceae bacterium]MBQ6694796.1 DUF4919 domain-containing protein [Bacteroidaceae bacterium]
MKRIHLTIAALFVAILSVQAQSKLDLNLIKETVENEKEYFNDILNVYLNDDPLIRIDDLALVYYGQSYLPEYRGSNDSNEEELKNHMAKGENNKAYAVAKKILAYNPVSLNALFYAWRTSVALGHSHEESSSYVTKYLNLLNMITTYGDGKNSRTPFYVISPDDQDHILYGMLDIENVKERKLDTETLCNIISVEPSKKFPARTVYINVSRFLSHTSKK